MNKIKQIFMNKNFIVVFLSIIVFGFVFLFLKDSLVRIDKKLLYDFYISNKYNKVGNVATEDYKKLIKYTKKIIVVQIDDDSIKNINEGIWPFSRDIYATVFDNLKKRGAKIVALDVILGNKGPNEEIDDKLALSIKNNGNIILGSSIYNKEYIEKPLKKFRKNALGIGYFNPLITKETNTVYSFLSDIKLYQKKDFIFDKADGFFIDLKKFYKKEKEKHFMFDIEILKQYQNVFSYKKKNGIYLGKTFIPYSGNYDNEILINFLKADNFQKISLYNVYKDDYKGYNNIDKDFFKDKIVLIGATAQGLKDIFNTPNGTDFGVYIHANIINTILSKQFLVYFDKTLEKILIFLLTIVLIYFNFSKNNRLLLISNIAIAFIFIFLPLLLLKPTNIILNYPASIIAIFILSITFSNIIKFLIESKNKNKMLNALSEYVSKDIAHKILEGNEGVKLDGESKKISIFFSDIAGFTTISEKMDAHGLVVFLREYLGSMSDIIMDEKGFINKYEGDAVMALFGVFGYESTSSYDNCLAALKQQNKLEILNKAWQKKYGEILSVRMGLHFGEAIVGNIGSKGRKMEFTALGDAVNLASRLEGVNKFYGTYICASETIYEDQKENFEFRKLDKIIVKGKNNAIMIYELLALKGQISNSKIEIVKNFEKALELYFRGEFKRASIIFKKLGKLGDKPSLVFYERCNNFEIEYGISIEKDWDGIWKFEKK